MVKAGKWIAKHRFIILLLGILLLIPSFIGMAKTRINYDLLSYLPESLETVEGQDVMVDEYGMGAFAMVVVEDTDMKDIQKLADQFNKVDHVEKVLWYCGRSFTAGRDDPIRFEKSLLQRRCDTDAHII